jgi:uncharacterized protein
LQWSLAKAFHISPFMPMDRSYRWQFTAPAKDLSVHMDVLRNEELEFDAAIALRRHPFTATSLMRVLWRTAMAPGNAFAQPSATSQQERNAD